MKLEHLHSLFPISSRERDWSKREDVNSRLSEWVDSIRVQVSR